MLDTVIIGSGPAGISAAIYAIRAGLSVLVIEKEFEGTGQIANTERVDNYPGEYGIGGYDLGEKFRTHALECGVTFKETDVVSVSKGTDGIFIVKTADEEDIKSKTVIYAAGARHRKLSALNAENFEGRGLSVCALCDGAFYKDKDVAIIGGGNSALEAALYMSKIARTVYLVHRRDVFRADGILIQGIRERTNIIPVLGVTPEALEGDTKLEGLKLSNGRVLEVQGVFSMIGMVPNTEAIASLGLTDDAGYVISNEEGITALAGFFAAGDVRTKKLRQVVTAVADGANAATSASSYLLSQV